MTDQEWITTVEYIADYSNNTREAILRAAGYLWDSSNWGRLSETLHGKFLREVYNALPDLTLRSTYRKQILEAKHG